MEQKVIEQSLDVILGVLLLVTAGACVALSYRLSRLRIERGEMEAFIAALATASERAESAIGGLKAAAADVERDLREHAEAARQRSLDLSRLIENGSRLARRLEGGLDTGARRMAGSTPPRDRPEPASGRHESGERDTLTSTNGQTVAGPAADLLRALETLR
jgi:hypothetical protein